VKENFKTCSDTFYWGEGACVECIQGCKTCNRDGVCTNCDTAKNFFMWRDMTCKFSKIVSFGLVAAISSSVLALVFD
jgi:hypothetical protein